MERAIQMESLMSEPIVFKLNDQEVRVPVDGDRALLWVLRTELGLTGTKFGCGEGHCGSCTVLVNQVAARSCLLKVKQVAGKEVVTIEGLAKDGKLHPVQKAFLAHDAMQCAFCTPGMVMTACALLHRNQEPTRAEIIQGMEHNLCRCGAHTRIIDAIQNAARDMKGGKTA
jgi:aerobic-type carbon monoxide dehydrogenase small subunit (CoxS/CutS family)